MDESPRQVIKKCVQVGISELLVCDTFARADHGLRVFYVLPTIELRNVFVRDRVDRPLLTVPYYRGRVRRNKGLKDVVEVDNVGLKSFGEKGLMLFVGSNSKVSFLAFPADKIIVDEFDKCHQDNLSLAEDRIVASDYKHRIDVSTPTVEGKFIDELYGKSDRKRWLIRCEHCGERQELDFFVNVIRETGDREFELLDKDWKKNTNGDVRVFCKKCGRSLNRLAEGEWVAEYPERSLSGYAVSQLFSLHLTVAKIVKTFEEALLNESLLQRFYNSILGLAYTASGSKLTKAILDECVKAGQNYNMPSRSEHTTMGVDVGSVLHVWICDHPNDNVRRLVFAGTVREFEDLHTLVARYGVEVAVVDIDPETRKAKEFRDEANCETWLCDYPSSPNVEEMKINYDERTIKTDRTQSLDGFVADILKQTLLLPANASSLDGGSFYEQLCASTRVFEEATGYYRWVEGSKADDYFHAGNYEKIASIIYSSSPEVVEAQYRPRKQWFDHLRKKEKYPA